MVSSQVRGSAFKILPQNLLKTELVSILESHDLLFLQHDSQRFRNFYYIQLRKMNMAPLVNKPYVNEVTLNEQNLYSKSC